MTHSSVHRSDEPASPLTPTSKNGHRALIEHLAQACVGSPQSPRRTASDTTRELSRHYSFFTHLTCLSGGTTVPLLYTELYHGNVFGQEMVPAKMAPVSDTRTNGSSYKHRAASSPDLEPLEEIDRCVLPVLFFQSYTRYHGANIHHEVP